MTHHDGHVIDERMVGLPTAHHGTNRGMIEPNNCRSLFEVFLSVEELDVTNEILQHRLSLTFVLLGPSNEVRRVLDRFWIIRAN